MVEIMETLPNSKKRHKQVLSGIDESIVRLVSEKMSYAVDAPGEVESTSISKHTTYEIRDDKVLPPEVPRDNGWDDETKQQYGLKVISSLQHADGIPIQVRDVDRLAPLLDERVFAHE